jgi:adenylate cyclase
MDPDELTLLITEYLEAVSGVIRAEGGTVDKFIGDAVMAFWGAPAECPDHASSACRAALAVVRTLDELASSWEARGLPRLSIRIGINSGQVVVGNVGSSERLNYTVLGDAVNLASRLEALGKRYGATALIGEATARQVEAHMVLRPLDYVAVAGKKEPVLVHELVGLRGEISEERLADCERYREALALYRRREFTAAADLFADLADAGDAAAKQLLKRCRRFAEEPPPEGWDGRHVMVEK